MTRDPWRDAFGNETRDELEAAVPDAVARDAWPRLAAELASRPPTRGSGLRWLVGGMAAALALMLSLSGWLAAENHALRQRGEVAASSVVAASTATVSGRTVTAGELVARLSLLPPETRVLSAAEATALLERDRPLLYALLQGPELDAVVADGLSAREAVAVLRRLDQTTPVNLGRGLTRRARTRS